MSANRKKDVVLLCRYCGEPHTFNIAFAVAQQMAVRYRIDCKACGQESVYHPPKQGITSER